MLGRAERGAPSDGRFNPATGDGHVAAADGQYAEAIAKQHQVIPLIFETFGGFSPEAVNFLKMARDHVNNKLNATQYQLTTWSARSWMSYQCQKISIALQRAAAFEIAAELGRVGAVGAGAAE